MGSIKILYNIKMGIYDPVTNSQREQYIEVEYPVTLVEGLPVITNRNNINYTRISSQTELKEAESNPDLFTDITSVMKYLKTRSFQKHMGIAHRISDKTRYCRIRPKAFSKTLTTEEMKQSFYWSRAVTLNPVCITASDQPTEDSLKTMDFELVVSNSAYDSTVKSVLSM